MTDDDRRPAGDAGSDDPLTRDLTELSNDVPDLDAVRSTVYVRLKTRQRRRRGAALTLAAASVVAVTVGGVALNAMQAAQAPAPVVAASSTAPFPAVAVSPQISTPASVAVEPSSASPRATYAAENVLLLLTDTRPTGNSSAGTGNATAGVGGSSDTTMVVHFSADRQHVSVLSIPRDTMIPAPACKAWNPTTGAVSNTASSMPPGQQFLFNSAYAVGGPSCTTAAVQALTGLKIDRFVGIDFTGFRTVVDALGAITVSACAPVLDGALGTILPAAGTRKVTGANALRLFRAREVVGENGSEMAQIRRQQDLFGALTRQIDKTGTLINPGKLDALLNVLARNTFTDNMTLENLVNLAGSIGDLKPGQVSFYTLPTDPSTADPKILKVKQPQADLLTQAIGNDQTASATSPTTGNRSGQSTGRPTTVQRQSKAMPELPAASARPNESTRTDALRRSNRPFGDPRSPTPAAGCVRVGDAAPVHSMNAHGCTWLVNLADYVSVPGRTKLTCLISLVNNRPAGVEVFRSARKPILLWDAVAMGQTPESSRVITRTMSGRSISIVWCTMPESSSRYP